MTIFSDDVTRRTQAVAIECAAHIAAIGQHHAGRTIPRLHVRRVKLIERAQVRVDAIDRLPRRRHQQPHGVHDIKATHDQQLEHVVEAL